MKAIGIISGMGPRAGLALYQAAIDIAAADFGASADADFPRLVVYSVPFIESDAEGLHRNPFVELQLMEALQQLALAGCKRIVIACNSLHALGASHHRAVVSLIDVGSNAAAAYPCVAVLASESARKDGLYATVANAIWPTDEEQPIVTQNIHQAMQGAHEPDEHLQALVQRLICRGATALLLGCTELPLLLQKVAVPVIDPGILAMREALDWYYHVESNS